MTGSNVDGTGVVNVSNNPSTDYATYDDLYASWTPNGRVLMRSNRTGAHRRRLRLRCIACSVAV